MYAGIVFIFITNPPNNSIGIKAIGSKLAPAPASLQRTPKNMPKRYPPNAITRYNPTILSKNYQIW